VQASKAVDTQLRQITDKLESRVDPFDLDVFSPHIHNHLTRQTQRSSVRTSYTWLEHQTLTGLARTAVMGISQLLQLRFLIRGLNKFGDSI